MIEEFHTIPPYSLKKEDKEKLLLKRLNELTELHYNKCEKYSNFLRVIGYSGKANKLEAPLFLV